MNHSIPPHRPTATTLPEARTAADGQLAWSVVVVVLLVSRGYLLLSLKPAISDVPFYWQTASRVVDRGEVPYGPGTEIGYPPLAWGLMYLPRWIDSTRWQPGAEHLALGRYSRRFRAQMALFDLTAVVLLGLLIARRAPQRLVHALWAYALLTLILGHLLYDRFDVALLALVMASAYAWMRWAETAAAGDDNASSWNQLAYIALGLGVALKLLPLVALPLLLVGQWRIERRGVSLLAALGCWSIGALFPFVWHLPRTGLASLGFLAHHAGRGLQVESIYASLLIGLSYLGLDVSVERSTNAWHVVGPGAGMLHRAAIGILFAWGLGWAVAAWHRAPTRGRMWLGWAAAVTIAGLPVLSHVLSPQYLIWATVLLLWPAAELLSRKSFHLFVALLVVITLLTTWLFPYHYFSHDGEGHMIDPYGLLPDLPWQASAVLLARNALLLGALAWIAHVVYWAPAAPSTEPSTDDFARRRARLSNSA